MIPRTTRFPGLLPALSIALLCSAILAPSTALAERQTLERIVAVVNDRVILASELEEEIAIIRQQLRQQGESPPPEAELRERLLDELIDESLQVQRARQYGISVSDEAVNRALRDVAEANGTDLTGLRDRLADEGIDFARLREDTRNRLIIQQLRQRSVASQVSITDQDIEEFLARIDRAEQQRTEFRVQHILISVPSGAGEDTADAAREDAAAVVDDLRAGADFADTAAEVSDGPEALSGGDLGWRGRDQLPALFVETLEDLRPGDISEPVQSANGFHILRLADRRGGASQTITETRARHILVRTGDDDGMDDAEARQRVADLRRRLEAGAAFEELARGHSDDAASAREGGDLGWFGPAEMTPAFQEAIDDLEQGELSEPFRTEHGWHIAEVRDRRERDDAERHRHAQARQALYRQRVEEEAQRWLRELRDEAFVDKRLDG